MSFVAVDPGHHNAGVMSRIIERCAPSPPRRGRRDLRGHLRAPRDAQRLPVAIERQAGRTRRGSSGCGSTRRSTGPTSSRRRPEGCVSRPHTYCGPPGASLRRQAGDTPTTRRPAQVAVGEDARPLGPGPQPALRQDDVRARTARRAAPRSRRPRRRRQPQRRAIATTARTISSSSASCRARDERAVDLHPVDREPAQVAERRVAGAEVVDGQPHAEVAQRPAARPRRRRRPSSPTR